MRNEAPWQYKVIELLRTLHMSAAGMLPELLDRFARECLGARGAELYLADFEQTRLLPADPSRAVEGFAVSGTMGGRSFSTGQVVETGEASERCVWFPVADGFDRIGVLALLAAQVEDEEQAGKALADLAALFVVAKGRYSDTFNLARRRQDMALAAEMQWHLLPPLTYMAPRVTIAGALEPAYEVGGDAFDYALNDDILHVAMIDAMGHGVRASLMATAAIGTYRNCRRRDASLGDTFTEMDLVIASQFADSFVTGQLAQLHVDLGLLRWGTAGHAPPLLVRQSRVIGQLEGKSTLPFGFGADASATGSTFQLEPGDAVVFLTDGITEARSGSREQFGVDRLSDFLERELHSELRPEELMRRLSHAILDHHDGKLHDDATLLMVSWAGN